MFDINDFLLPELAFLIPVLYILGMVMKDVAIIKDRFIPLFLGLIGIAVSIAFELLTYGVSGLTIITGFCQGIMYAGCSVYANQLYKQLSKGESDE